MQRTMDLVAAHRYPMREQILETDFADDQIHWGSIRVTPESPREIRLNRENDSACAERYRLERCRQRRLQRGVFAVPGAEFRWSG